MADIVAFGDSNTQGAFLAPAESWPMQLAKMTGLEVHNAGVGGNTTRHALARFEADVLQHRPKLVVLEFGMNDHVYTADKVQRVSSGEYETNLVRLVELIQAGGAQVVATLIHHVVPEYYYSRHPMQWYPLGIVGEINHYNSIIGTVFLRRGLPVINIPHAFSQSDPAYASAASHLLRTLDNAHEPDGVHFTPEGAQVFASAVYQTITSMA